MTIVKCHIIINDNSFGENVKLNYLMTVWNILKLCHLYLMALVDTVSGIIIGLEGRRPNPAVKAAGGPIRGTRNKLYHE